VLEVFCLISFWSHFYKRAHWEWRDSPFWQLIIQVAGNKSQMLGNVMAHRLV
jgi:hypothetical protein